MTFRDSLGNRYDSVYHFIKKIKKSIDKAICCMIYLLSNREWGVSSAGRAPALHAGGHRFDPDTLHHDRSEEIPNGIFFCALFKWYKKISRFHILQQEKIREYGFFISSYIYDFAYRHQTEVHIPSQSRTGYSPCADGYGKYLTS